MSDKEWEYRGSYKAIDDSGNSYEIRKYTLVEKWHDTGGGGSKDGVSDLTTSDGRGVNRLSRSNYEIIDPMGNINVRSDDPDAP